jgi:polyribonucleotide nucleotidyltransferase
MFKIVKKEITWAGRNLVIETGKIARQADGAVVVNYGETTVLCTAVARKTAKEGVDFLPLTVDYKEMAFAAGKIPGGFHKREGRSSEREILVSRLIDRPLRPLFPEHFHNEVQVVCSVLSYDGVNNPDIAAIVGASAAVALAGLPVSSVLAAAKVGYINNEFILNPTEQEMPSSLLDLIIAGTEDSVMMVESEASELSEKIMLDAVVFGHKGFQPVINMIKELVKEAGISHTWNIEKPDMSKLFAAVNDAYKTAFTEAYHVVDKAQRREKLASLRMEVVSTMVVEHGYSDMEVRGALSELEHEVVRSAALDNDRRIDGRNSKQIRNIEVETGILSRTHGSALFTRGETQALVVATLGTTEDEQMVDYLGAVSNERFLLHYNFPSYSVGETGPLKGPGRREIGHGKLAWRALNRMIPGKDKFPYTIRIVSEITESNGSSSMATVCGASLALMDAGIPLAKPVAGIAMGLIKEGDKFVVLSDIMGDEDHLGDMDFKVAGTDKGVTALQMDIKITGISPEIMDIALNQAREGINHILGKMATNIEAPRDSISKNAPSITSFNIPREKIREVIGSGGSVIKKICEVSGAKIEIEDDGSVRVIATSGTSSDIAINMIKDIVAEPEIGQVYSGNVVRVMEFGAFVNFLGSRDGLVHISEISDERIADINTAIKEGDVVKVLVTGVDNRGKVKLSMRLVDQATGALKPGYEQHIEQEANFAAERRSGGKHDSRPPRRERRSDDEHGKRKYFN